MNEICLDNGSCYWWDEVSTEVDDGTVMYKVRDGGLFNKSELRVLGPHATQSRLDYLSVSPLSWRGVAVNGRIRRIHSTPTFPIFLLRRHWFYNAADSFFIWMPHAPRRRQEMSSVRPEGYVGGIYEIVNSHKVFDTVVLLPEFNCRDILSLLSRGYQPVWLDSRTDALSDMAYSLLQAHSRNLLYLPFPRDLAYSSTYERFFIDRYPEFRSIADDDRGKYIEN